MTNGEIKKKLDNTLFQLRNLSDLISFAEKAVENECGGHPLLKSIPAVLLIIEDELDSVIDTQEDYIKEIQE